MISSSEILVIGNNSLDQVFTIESTLFESSKVSATYLCDYAGGQAANAAHTFAGLGLKVNYLGNFGDDASGVILADSLSRAAVELHGCEVIDGCRSHVAAVILNRQSGERTIVMYKDPRLAISAAAVNSAWHPGLKLVYTDGHEENATHTALSLGKESGVPILGDLEEPSSFARAIISNLTYVVAPASVLMNITGQEIIEHALKATLAMGPNIVVATCGSGGSYGLASSSFSSLVYAPAIPCVVTDTTGAGDAYHAGFGRALVSGLPLTHAMKFATQIAAAKCGEAGPRLSLEKCRELVHLLPTEMAE